MNTVQISLPVDLLLEQLEQFDVPTLDRISQRASALRHQKASAESANYEAHLVEQINTALPESMRKRFDELQNKLLAETLTEDEQVEFIAISDEAEQLRNERLSALGKLSALKNESVEQLAASFELS